MNSNKIISNISLLIIFKLNSEAVSALYGCESNSIFVTSQQLLCPIHKNLSLDVSVSPTKTNCNTKCSSLTPPVNNNNKYTDN